MQHIEAAEAAHQCPLVGAAAAVRALDVHQPEGNAQRQPASRHPYRRRAHYCTAPGNLARGALRPGYYACSPERAISQASTCNSTRIWHSRRVLQAAASRKEVGH